MKNKVLEIVKQNVGIDVSKDKIDVTFSELDAFFDDFVVASRKFANTPKGFIELQGWVNSKKRPNMAVHFTMEATGVYYEALAYFLYQQEDYRVHVVLKPNKETIARTEKHISFLDSQINQIEKDIKKFVDMDNELKNKMKFLLSIKGAGMVTATTIVAETNGFAAFESIKQVVGFAGLDVRIAESGKWKGKSKISKRGNSYIRSVLYMPTLSKIRHDKATKQAYERLKEKKGVGMIAVVAQMRKMLAMMYTLWKKQEMFKDISAI